MPYRIDLDGRRYAVKAKMHVLSGYSAHADQRNLVHFVERMRKRPKEVVLVHGERQAKEALGRKLRGLGVDVR